MWDGLWNCCSYCLCPYVAGPRPATHYVAASKVRALWLLSLLLLHILRWCCWSSGAVFCILYVGCVLRSFRVVASSRCEVPCRLEYTPKCNVGFQCFVKRESQPNQASVLDVPLECLFYMTFRFTILEKHTGNNEVPPFLRVDLRYYSLLSIIGILAAILLSLNRLNLSHFECL